MEQSTNSKLARAKRRRLVWGIIVTVLFILFAIWAGWGWFIFLPLIVDYYFLHFIKWPKLSRIKNKRVRSVVSLLGDVLFAVVGVTLLSTYFFQNFAIPSSSLEKTLLVGDYLFVDKLSYGPRAPMTPLAIPLTHNTFRGHKSYSDKPHFGYRRLKGFGTPQRGDLVVFNFPAGDTVALKMPNPDYYTLKAVYGEETLRNRPDLYGKIVYRPVDRRDHYVKRCVAVPGDTLFIHDGIYMIGDGNVLAGNIESQKRIMKFNPDNIPDDQYYTLPFDSIVRWNIREFGPFYIPGKNDSIPMNRTNYLLYKKIIVWEQGEEVLFQDEKVYLGNKELDGYRFKSNYYFMSGDNSMNSVDSRFWGLIPEDFIVGKAALVITSRSRDTGKIRWNRVFKRIE